MVTVYCFTNLDYFKHGWPSQLPEVPRVGDYIESLVKSPKGYTVELKVCAIRWKHRRNAITEKQEWVPYAELSIPDGESLSSFYSRMGVL